MHRIPLTTQCCLEHLKNTRCDALPTQEQKHPLPSYKGFVESSAFVMLVRAVCHYDVIAFKTLQAERARTLCGVVLVF